MENFDFQYNASNLDLMKLHQTDKITLDEIISVFENPRSRFREQGESNLSFTIFIKIGYSTKKRVLLIAFMYPEYTIDFIGAKIATESELDSFYCQG